jgi:hypothetical protein
MSETDKPKRSSLDEAQGVSLNNWRGRRFALCRALDDVQRIVDHLGVELDGEAPPNRHDEDGKFFDVAIPPVPDGVKREVNNQVAALLRLLLVLNDASMSDTKLRTF